MSGLYFFTEKRQLHLLFVVLAPIYLPDIPYVDFTKIS